MVRAHDAPFGLLEVCLGSTSLPRREDPSWQPKAVNLLQVWDGTWAAPLQEPLLLLPTAPKILEIHPKTSAGG